MWDLAVAELMTQVVVVMHCHDGDMCFEGLRRYLLTLGFTPTPSGTPDKSIGSTAVSRLKVNF